MNIYLSPISSILLGFILALVFIHYLVLIEFYYKNKDKLNNPEFISSGYKCEEIPQKGSYYGVEYDYIEINREEV